MGDGVALLFVVLVAAGTVLGAATAAFLLFLAAVKAFASQWSADRRYAARVARGLEDPPAAPPKPDAKTTRIEDLVRTWRAAQPGAPAEHEEAVRWAYARIISGTDPEQGSVDEAMGYLERFGADMPEGVRA